MCGEKNHTLPIGREQNRVARHHCSAFTLIELLVVIAIIAVIAGMVFPVFAQAREAARKTACLSNQKQIGTAMLMYAQDYDEVIVPAFIMPHTATLEEKVAGCYVSLLEPYIKNREVWFDPAWSEQKMKDGIIHGCGTPGFVSWVFPAKKILGHYAASHYFKANRATTCTEKAPYAAFPGSSYDIPYGTPQTWYQTTLGQVVRTSETVWATDGFISAGVPWQPESVAGHGFCSGSRMHTEGGNYIFVDGHAKHMKISLSKDLAETDGCWHRKYQAFDL